MADIGAATRTKLVGTAAVAAILGTRVYPDHLPQAATLPACVYTLIGGQDELSLAGMIGVAQQRIQIDSYASTRTAANALAVAVRNALCGTASGRGTWGTVGVHGCNPVGGEMWDTQSLGDGGDERQWICIRDFLVFFDG